MVASKDAAAGVKTMSTKKCKENEPNELTEAVKTLKKVQNETSH